MAMWAPEESVGWRVSIQSGSGDAGIAAFGELPFSNLPLASRCDGRRLHFLRSWPGDSMEQEVGLHCPWALSPDDVFYATQFKAPIDEIRNDGARRILTKVELFK